MGTPRVAVLIPCHNDGDLLVEAVDSVRRDPEPTELVVVDDGSVEKTTHDVLARLEADGVRVVRQKQAGPGCARTTGLRATSAPYVFPLDADDQVLPGALTALADLLDAAPAAAFAWGDYEIFGDSVGYYRSPREPQPWTLLYRNVYPISSLIRREALVAAGGWQDRGYEDWALWLKLLELGYEGVPSGRAVYRRRVHGTGRNQVFDRRKHREIYGRLRERAPGAFARRRELRRLERPGLGKRIVMPLLFGARPIGSARAEALVKRVLNRAAPGRGRRD